MGEKQRCCQLLIKSWLFGVYCYKDIVWLPGLVARDSSLTSQTGYYTEQVGFVGWLLQMVGQSSFLLMVWLWFLCIFSLSLPSVQLCKPEMEEALEHANKNVSSGIMLCLFHRSFTYFLCDFQQAT